MYQPRYLLAQFYFRRQNPDNFWKWSRSALEIAYGDVTALLDLGWRMQPDSDWIWQYAIPARREIVRQYLVFLGGKRQWDTARTVAFREGEAINERALLAMFRQIIANNRAGGWRAIKGG